MAVAAYFLFMYALAAGAELYGFNCIKTAYDNAAAFVNKFDYIIANSRKESCKTSARCCDGHTAVEVAYEFTRNAVSWAIR